MSNTLDYITKVGKAHARAANSSLSLTSKGITQPQKGQHKIQTVEHRLAWEGALDPRRSHEDELE